MTTAPAPAETKHAYRAAPPRTSRKRIGMRVAADAIAVSAALFAASIIRFEVMDESPAASLDYGALTAIATPLYILLFFFYGLYEPRQVLGPMNELKQVFHAVIAGVVLLFIADSALNLKLARGWALIALVTGLLLVGGERLALRRMLHFMRRRGADLRRTIVLGANHEAATVARTLERERWLGYEIVGFVADGDPQAGVVLGNHSVIGPTSELTQLISRHDVGLIVIASSAFGAARLNRLLWELQACDVDLQMTSGTIDLVASRMVVQSVGGVPLMYVRRTGMDRLQRTLKRALDIVGAGGALLLLSPVLAAIAVAIRRDSEGGAIFKQVRVGRDGELFACWKFRTMVMNAEELRAELEDQSEGPGLLFKLKEDPRITSVGKALRKYSLDELPQLWNVLRGHMSLVGPRPALPVEVEQYDDWVRNRLTVKPGMTGLWQISGRTETSFIDYVRYDLFYIQNWSLSLDLWILWRTTRAVITAEGAH